MKIIDENGRLWGKISVIDLLVIAVVLVMALALYVKNVRMNADQKPVSGEPAQTITIQVRAEAQKNYIFNSLHVGDEIGTPITSTARTSWASSPPSRWRTTPAPPSPA